MKLSIIGTGYVGLVTGACLADSGHEVICVDVDQRKVDLINSGRAPIHEVGLPELLNREVGRRLRASRDLAAAVTATERTLIAVGTPAAGSISAMSSRPQGKSALPSRTSRAVTR